MAKSARASRLKTNKTKLRKFVHAPVEEARLQRLSDKLMEIANANKTAASSASAMDVEEKGTEQATEQAKTEGDMEVDQGQKPAGSWSKSKHAASKINRRRRHGTAKHSVIFQNLKKGSGGRRHSKRK
ncbi:hypothetical protein RUND412_009181 [Rhizina undulata]